MVKILENNWIRTILKSVSEQIRKMFWISFVPIRIRTNQNGIEPSSDFLSIRSRVDLNHICDPNNSEVGIIGMGSDCKLSSNSFGLKSKSELNLKLIRINQIESDYY